MNQSVGRRCKPFQHGCMITISGWDTFGDEITQLVRRADTELVVQYPPAVLKLPPSFADIALREVHPDDKAVSALAQLLHMQGTCRKL